MTTPRMIFVNLPVTVLGRSKAFYEAIGFRYEPKFRNDAAAMMVLSDTISVMLLTHPFYASFTRKQIADAHSSSQVMLCISCDSPAEVDRITNAAGVAGGKTDSRREAKPRAVRCTGATSKIPTAINGSRCGWTRTSLPRARTRSKPPRNNRYPGGTQ